MFVKPEKRARDTVIRRFFLREDGNMIMLGLMFFTLMVMMGGMAVDLMRFEERRTQLQQTTDRAVLAAASMRQTLDPKSVVNDYFLKAGLTDKLKSVDVVQSYNAKSVAVTAATDVQPFFMQMMGIQQLTAPAAGTAIEKISDVEISMVLDVSGSMGTNNKIGNLKTAAKEFVDTILTSSEDGRASISIVPYNMQVDPGVTLAQVLGYQTYHANSYCVDWKDADFNTTVLGTSAASALQQTAFADFATTSTASAKTPSTSVTSQSYFACPKNLPTILPVSKNATTLKSKIDSFTAAGNTSIDIGMKWGVELLDPGSTWIVDGLVSKGAVSNVFSGRPLNPADKEVLKVLILMTDGENTTQYGLNDPYDGSTTVVGSNTVIVKSPVYRDSSGNLALYYPAAANVCGNYYSPAKSYSIKCGSSNKATTTNWAPNPFNTTTGWTQLTWPEVWTYTTPSYVEKFLYAGASGQSQATWTKTLQAIVDKTTTNVTGGSTKDARLNKICTAAKAKGIVVFGIGFADSATTPVSGKPQILSCSTSSAYYYDVAGLQITTAFRSIASQISTLRLTQ